MRASPWSIAIVMLLLGVAALGFPIHHGVRPSAAAIVVALALLIGGGALFTRRREAFFIAIGGAIVTTGCAVIGLFTRQELGLPMPPLVSIVLGLYVCFRIVAARSALAPRQASAHDNSNDHRNDANDDASDS